MDLRVTPIVQLQSPTPLTTLHIALRVSSVDLKLIMYIGISRPSLIPVPRFVACYHMSPVILPASWEGASIHNDIQRLRLRELMFWAQGYPKETGFHLWALLPSTFSQPRQEGTGELRLSHPSAPFPRPCCWGFGDNSGSAGGWSCPPAAHSDAHGPSEKACPEPGGHSRSALKQR